MKRNIFLGEIQLLFLSLSLSLGLMNVQGQEIQYDDLYPYYVKYCTLTRYHPKNETGVGGKGGHAVLYIKGLCLDSNQDYPQLIRCDQNPVTLKDPNQGVGLSTNRHFRNVNWVGIPGQDLFWRGGLTDENFDQNQYDKLVNSMADLGLFQGIQTYSENDGDQTTLAIVKKSLGTDYGINLARGSYCVTIPIVPSMLDPMKDFLNQKNQMYREKDFKWNVFSNNCTHMANNTMAAAGITFSIKTDQIILKQIFNLAVPANIIINFAEKLINDSFNVENIYKDPIARETFLKDSWILGPDGFLFEKNCVYGKNGTCNHFFEEDLDMFVLSPDPYLKKEILETITKPNTPRKMLNNLKMALENYQEESIHVEQILKQIKSDEGNEFGEFLLIDYDELAKKKIFMEKMKIFLGTKIQEIKNKISQLDMVLSSSISID